MRPVPASTAMMAVTGGTAACVVVVAVALVETTGTGVVGCWMGVGAVGVVIATDCAAGMVTSGVETYSSGFSV